MKNTIKDLKARARAAIIRDEDFIYDVAVENGVVIDDVRNERWFLDAVMSYFVNNFEAWSHLQEEIKRS